MIIQGILPIGSVVLLRGGNHRVMILGYCQRMVEKPSEVYDYVACLFPEGYISVDKNFLFNADQVEKVYHVGYQTDGQQLFCDQIEATLKQLRTSAQSAEEK